MKLEKQFSAGALAICALLALGKTSKADSFPMHTDVRKGPVEFSACTKDGHKATVQLLISNMSLGHTPCAGTPQAFAWASSEEVFSLTKTVLQAEVAPLIALDSDPRVQESGYLLNLFDSTVKAPVSTDSADDELEQTLVACGFLDASSLQKPGGKQPSYFSWDLKDVIQAEIKTQLEEKHEYTEIAFGFLPAGIDRTEIDAALKAKKEISIVTVNNPVEACTPDAAGGQLQPLTGQLPAAPQSN